jgi:hypothetical protein
MYGAIGQDRFRTFVCPCVWEPKEHSCVDLLQTGLEEYLIAIKNGIELRPVISNHVKSCTCALNVQMQQKVGWRKWHKQHIHLTWKRTQKSDWSDMLSTQRAAYALHSRWRTGRPNSLPGDAHMVDVSVWEWQTTDWQMHGTHLLRHWDSSKGMDAGILPPIHATHVAHAKRIFCILVKRMPAQHRYKKRWRKQWRRGNAIFTANNCCHVIGKEPTILVRRATTLKASPIALEAILSCSSFWFQST